MQKFENLFEIIAVAPNSLLVNVLQFFHAAADAIQSFGQPVLDGSN